MNREVNRGERGQATVEFALTLPMIVLAAWLPIAAAGVATAQIDIASAARNAAREAAMSPNPGTTAREAARASTDRRPLTVVTSSRGGILRVEVFAPYRLRLPVPSAMIPSILLRSGAAVSSEMHPGAVDGDTDTDPTAEDNSS